MRNRFNQRPIYSSASLMTLPRRGSISTEELLLLSFAGPALFSAGICTFLCKLASTQVPQSGTAGQKNQDLSSQCSNTASVHKSWGDFIHPLKAHFDGIKRLQDIPACSKKVDYQGFVGIHKNADRAHPPEASESRAKNKQTNEFPQIFKPDT